MSFTQKYSIIPRYITPNSKRRSSQLISPTVKFIVAHDTGNPESTAADNVSYYTRTYNDAWASAHIFADDKEIIECIPALTAEKPEKAWHVQYNVSKDNELYGYEANDAAIGIEYCYGANINVEEAYKRYIWILAYTCFKFNLNPKTAIVGHFILDPGRRSDPVSGLAAGGKNYNQLLNDIETEYNSCLNNSTNTNNPMKLIKNSSSNKIYAIGSDNKKHWIFNEETFNAGRDMGLWENWDAIEAVDDDSFFAEGHSIFLVRG